MPWSSAGVFGWIAIGYEVGQRFTKAIHQNWHPAFSAGLGTFALTLVAKVLTGIPVLNCVGWLVPFLLSMAALGAVLMTRFGTQMVTAPTAPATVVPDQTCRVANILWYQIDIEPRPEKSERVFSCTLRQISSRLRILHAE